MTSHRLVGVSLLLSCAMITACNEDPPPPRTPLRPDTTLRNLSTARIPDVCSQADSGLRGRGDTPALRAAAALRHGRVYSMREMMPGMVDSMAVQMPLERRTAFIDLMTKAVDYNALDLLMCNAIAKHFEVAEIDALTAFYGSPAGRRAMQKFGPYMTDIMPGIMYEMQRASVQAAGQR